VISNIQRLARQGDDRRESGQALIEYALILMLVAFVAFGVLQALGTSVAGAISDTVAGFDGG
jgi:Flp pilus assembly pilin Flp